MRLLGQNLDLLTYANWLRQRATSTQTQEILHNEPLTFCKDELLNHVWQGRIVEENRLAGGSPRCAKPLAPTAI
jgi:hypothetical protein